MAFSEFGGFFDTIKPVTKSEFDTSSSSSSLPKLGGSSGLPSPGSSGWGKGLKKLGKGGLADISETSDSYHGQNLRTLDSLGGINGFWAYDRAFSAKDTTGKGVAGNPELQAAIREITGPNAIIQDEGGNIITAQSAADAVSKMNNQSASGQSVAPAEPATPAQAENGQIFQQGLGKKGDKIRMPGGAISYKTATVGSQSQPNPYDEAQPSNPYDEGQQQSDAESAWYDNAVRTASKKLYGIDIDALEMPDVNGQHIENPVLDNWKSNLREFIRLNNESYRRKLSKKEVEAWQAAGNLAYSSQGSLKLFSALMKNNKIPADADTSEVWNDAANAIVAMDQGKLDKYFPGLYDSNMYQAAMKQAQNGDTTQLEAVSQLLQPVIDSRAAAEAPGNPGTVLTSGDFWKWMYDTAGDALVRGVMNVKGFAKDLYYRARISDDDAPMTDAERAENERLKAARLYNLEETHRVDEWADKDMQRINDASEIYKTQELIRRGRDYMNDRDRENSFWGGVASTWDALKRAPVYTIGSYSAESADTLVGMAVGGGVGGGVGKLTQLAVNRALNGAFRSAAGAALAGGEGAAEAGAAALSSAARKINWYTFAGETLGSGASSFVNIGAMNVAGDAQAAASRPVAELVKDPEFAKFYAEQSDSVLTGSVLPVMAILSSSDDSRMPELRSLVSQLQLNQVDANGQPLAITAEDKKRILAFYDNPLVQQAVDSGAASSPLINKYRSHIYNRTWDNNIWQNSMLGVAEGALSPVAGGVFRGRLGGVGGLITDRVKSKLAKAGLSTAYVLGEGGGTEALEQIVSNIGMNQAQGRDPYENLMRNVGESFMAGAIISGVLSTPNAAIAMFRHSGKAQDTGGTGDTGITGTDNGPQDNGPSGTPFSPFDSGIYTDASGLDSGSYDHGASFAESVRNDPAVKRASIADYNVPGSDRSDTPVFHDSDGNEIAAPSAAELDRDIDAVRTARDTLAKQYGEVEAKLKQTTDEAERKALTEQASKMRDVWKEQTQVLRTLHAARRYYKAKAQEQTQEQTQGQEQTQQTQGQQAQEQTQQTQEQNQGQEQTQQAQGQQPKVRTGRQTTVREVKEGRRASKPTDEQQALLDKLNEYEKTQSDGARWEAINDHELVRRKPKGKSRAYNMDYLTVGDDGKWSVEPLRNLTDEQKKLWEAYRNYKKWSPKLGAEELYDNGQLTGVAWGSTGKGSKNRNKGNITFAQMEQELAASGVNWKGTEEEQTEEQAAPAAEEQTEEVPAKPSCEQEFDEAISNLNPEDSTSVDDLLDAAHALVEEIIASSNSAAELKGVYDRLDKALLNLEFGQRIAYIGPSTKDWLADVRHRQMMFHLARTLGAKTKAKSPNYFAFDLLMGFIINSSDMLGAIDNYRLHMGDGFVDAVKTVAGSDAWKKSGKFVDDYRAYRGAPVRGWSDIAQNVIAVIAPPAPAAEQPAPAPAAEQPASELESSAEFKKLPEPLQKYLLNPEHKLNSSDWSKLAEVAKLTPAENGKLTMLVAESDNAAVLTTGTGYTTAFLRFLKSEGFEIGDVCEVQIKQEDEQAAAAKKQAEEAKRKAEEEQKLQSMLMPEDEQTGDWGNYNSRLSRADHVVPVHEGLSIDLTGGAENLVPVQQMTDKPMKRSELRARELNADSNVHATIYTKSGTGRDRLIAVPFEEDAVNSKLISENPKRLADWLNMKLPDGASWAKGYSPLDVLIAFFGQISSGKKPKAGTKYYLKYYKGLTVQSIPIPAGGIGESSTGSNVYANKIKDSGGINGLPALYAGLIQELISINNHIAADHKGSFNSDVLQSDPVVIEAGDSVIVIGVETGIGQPYSGTVLISKDEARKEGMLPEEESAPAAQPQAQAQPQTESAQPKADTSGINGQLRGFIISYITSPQRQNIPDIIDRVPIATIQASLKADITREQIQAVYDEAVEAVRTAMSRGTPLTDEERAKYGLTNDRWISYISENMTDGTEHSEGQAGAERDSAADSGEESGESTSETGSENSGSAGRTGEATESAGNVGTGTSGERPAEGNNGNPEQVSAAAEGTDESSVPVNPAPAAPAAGDGAGVVTGEGSGSEGNTAEEADAGESAEQPDRREPPVAEPDNDQTRKELAKVDLARKALKYYKDHTELSRGTVREAIANSLDSQGKLLAKLPAGYKDIVLDTLTDAVLNVMDSFHALSEYTSSSPLMVAFGKEAKYEPDVNRITIPVATALKMTMPAAQKVFGKFTHDPDSDTFVYAKQTYNKADVLKNLLPAMLHAFMWHECAHALFHGVHYNRYNLSAPLRNAIDSTVDQFIRATGIKLPEGHENWARDEIFATGMEMAVLYMRSGNTPATQAVALLTNRFVKAMPELSRLVCATYEPFNYLPYDSYSLKRAIELMNGPLEMLYNGTDKRLMGRDEDSMRIAWKILFARNPEAVNRYVQLLSFMSGEMLNTHNALSYVLNTISGMANNDDSIDSRRLNGRYAMSILRPTRAASGTALDEAKLTIANKLGLRLRDLELLVPDIDQRINDDIAMARRLKSETEQYMALATDQSDFNAMCSELESALLSGIDADTGAAAQAKPNSQLERNGAANPTPAQEQRSQVEEDKTQGEREKASETANALADNSKLKEDKTPAQEQAEQNADNLITAGVASANANANENGAELEDLSLTSPYIQEITDSINAAIDKNASYTQYEQLNFMLGVWRGLIKSYGDWLGKNLLRGDVSSNDLMHILNERLDYASFLSNKHYSDSQIRLMAVWLNNFITNSELGSAIKQAYTGKDWERDDNVIIENSDGTRKVEERQFLSDFHDETINRAKAAADAKAAAAKAKADAEAAEAAKAAADAKARALSPDEISEELEKPAPLSPREQQDWKLETELDDQLNIFNRPNKKDTDDGVEDAEDPVGHTNVNIDENSAAVKVAAYLRMATGDENDDAVSQWLGFLFENGWGLKKLLLAKTHNKEELHMTLADFRQVMLDGEIDADVVEKIIYALDNYTNLFDIIETHHPDFRTAPANKQLGKYLGEYAESDRIENLSERIAEITDYAGTKDDIILAISEIVDGVYTIDTSITAEDSDTRYATGEPDSGVRYYASEANDMTEDEAQQTIDETTSSEPDPETPADTGEDTEAAEEELAGTLDDEDSSETPDTDAESQAAAINLDVDMLGDDVADRKLDDAGMDVLDTLFTPDELKEMAPDLARNAAKLTRVVKTYGVYRRAFMEQMRNAFSANRVFRENKYVRNYMNHFIDNWDRSIASLETWAIENYQGAVSPEDNPVIQSILLARRMASSYTEAVNDILQRGMTMNENGARVRILDENGKPVESVLDVTTRMYDRLKELGLRRDVLDTKENFRKDVGMFRTLLHTIEANEYKYEEMKAQYAKLTEDYNAEASKPKSDKATLDKIYKQRSALRLDIENFEKLMKKDSLNDVKIDSRFTLPMGGRSIAMAHNELDALYAKYDTALKDAGVDDATRAETLKEMIVSFNVAYKYAIQEMDMLSARSGLLSEATILQRHNFKYYTPLRQDIGDGRGRNIEARKGSVTPAVDAITNYAMQAIRNSGSVSRNVLGMTLFDAWNAMHDEYERIYHDPNASPEEKMRIISHQSVGETYSFNGLLLIRRQDMERIPEGDERFEAFKKQAIFVEIVQPAGEDELVDSNLERFWIGFDPDVIGRARKSEVKEKPVSSQRDLHGIQNDAGEDPDKPGYILYPEVQPRDYSDAGKALVDIAYEPSAKLGNFLKTCGFLTRTASEAMTTFNPLFALKSAISDFRERITRLGRREFADSNGRKVSGVRIALRMWRLMMNPKFLGTAFKYSVELASHKVTGNDTQYRKYLNEMHKYGIIGGVQQQMVATGGSRRSLFGLNASEKISLEIEKARALQEAQTNKEAETLVSKLYRILGEKTHDASRTRIGKFLHAVHNAAIGWSNMFYNVPLAAQYVAMRECGLSAQSAAADTAKAMDFTNRGYYHKVGSKFVSFLTSITHGTANMLDSYGINRNTISSNPYLKETGYARRMNMQSYAFKAARLSAYLALVQVLLYAVGASLRPHEPDKRKAGQQLIDNMPLRNMYFLPVPILQWLGIQDENGVVAKLTGGFGEDRLALNLAWGLERWSRGKATLSEVAGSYMVNFTRNATPFEAPNFDMTNNPARYMAYSVGHTVPLMAWAVDAALNITYNGRTLDGQFGPAMGQRAYEEHNAYVDIAYKDLSKTMYDVLGVNISPSTIKSMYEGMGYGPVVQGLMQLALHIGDSVPRSRLDPNWANANVNAIAQFFGATSLGNKMPDKPYVYISQLRKYYNDLFVEGGVSSMLKANGAGTKVAAIQQTMRMMGFSSAEIADMVNMHEMDNKLTGILKKENALIDLRRSGGISVDQFTKRMNGLIRQANTLQTNYMKGSYYYRGVYPKRSGIPEKYRARLERENRLDAIRRANAIVDKESK